MDKPLSELYRILQKLTGLHRQLLETVRSEKEALAEANLKAIERCTSLKQGLVEAIAGQEQLRVQLMKEIALAWKRPLEKLTLLEIAIAIQEFNPKGAEQFRGVFNVLTLLVQRILEQNRFNLSLIEKSLTHIQQMKKNVLSEEPNTYTAQGQTQANKKNSRLLSKEA